MKHANSILETFEYFCQILSKSIHIISSYTVSKLGPFLRHSVELETAAMQHINDLTVLNTESFTGVMYRMSFVNVTT